VNRPPLTRFAWLSIAAALATMALKALACLLTGSVGLLSDAIESLVNLAGGVMALAMLSVAARPADEEHAFGHHKAEYFSSGFEGSLIVLAAAAIGWTAVNRLLAPRPLTDLGLGLAISVGASLVNLAAAVLLLRAGRRHDSITLEADARHLLADVWTSVGVVAGVGAVALTDWQRLDPIIALAVAANIVRTGVGIVRRSVGGLMDQALAPADQARIDDVLAAFRREGIQFHAVMTRQAGARKFVSLHVLVPGDWTVSRGHELLERLEAEIRRALAHTIVFTHLEPQGDPASWADEKLERSEPAARSRPP